MGLTPLEGLVMGTRTGDFDPAILFFLSDKGYSIAALNQLCNKQSGLIGVSGFIQRHADAQRKGCRR